MRGRVVISEAPEPTVDHARLEALLGEPALAWLLERCRRRLARGQALEGTVTRTDASSAEREATARLLGRPPGRGSSLSIPLGHVEAVLTDAGVAPDLATAVQALTGPVDDALATASAHAAHWERVWDEAGAWARERDDASDAGLPWRAAVGTSDAGPGGPDDASGPRQRWLARVRADGLLRRLAGGDPAVARDLVAAAIAVVDELPAGGESRSVIAARALGDGHALDDDRPVATLVLRAIDELTGSHPGADRREHWAAAGVAVDALTSRVTVLGLPGDTSSPTGRALAVLAEAAEPASLTLRQLVGAPPDLAGLANRAVFVCENPSVVAAAADRLGTRCAPLVCTGGQPSLAARLLLDRLAAAGARVRVHADLDWAGLRIAAGVIDRTGASPWRMVTGDYEAAAARSRKPLAGAPAPSPWDRGLAAAMRTRGVAVEEELVLDALLADLAIDGPGPPAHRDPSTPRWVG